jgi:vitamin K-dependent gamma-carboxylase
VTAPGSRIAATADWLAEPVDPASFTVFRVAFGVLLAVEAFRYLWNDWIAGHLLAPAHHFAYPGLAWVRPLGPEAMTGVLVALAAGGLAVAAGLLRRPVAAALAVGWAWLLAIDATLYLNHHYLVVVVCIWLALIPSRVPRWGVWALRGQLAIVYFWAGVSKLDGDWFAGMPLFLSVGGFLPSREAAAVASWAVIVMELGIVPLLLWGRTRAFTMVFFVVFHLATIPLYEIGIFPYLSMALLSLWLDPAWPRRWASFATASQGAPRSATLALAVAFFALQAAFPARSLVAEGHPSWTMTHSRYTWRLLTAHKTGWVRFELETEAGERREISPLAVFTPWQTAKIARDPWLMRDAARWLAEEQVRQGFPPVRVHVKSAVSLNGRRAVPVVDAAVDLAAVRDDQALHSWLLPLTEPLPDEPFVMDEAELVRNLWGYDHYLELLRAATAAGDDGAARLALADALALDPRRPDAPLARVEALVAADRADDALVVVAQWIEADPEAQLAWLQRGLLHLHAGRPALARPALERAAELGPDKRVRQALARLAAEQGRADEARRWLEEIRAADPADVTAALLLAELLTDELHDPDAAAAMLAGALKHNPGHPALAEAARKVSAATSP